MLCILASERCATMPNLLTESLHKSFIRYPQTATIKDTFPACVPTLKDALYIPLIHPLTYSMFTFSFSQFNIL